MPGANRRNRRLKQTGTIGEITDFSSVNPTDGDLLVFSGTDGVYENTKSLTGDYDINGQLQVTDLVVDNDVDIANDLTVDNDATIGGALAVTGLSVLTGGANVGGTLQVTGPTTLSSTLSLAGALTGSGFSFTGNGNIAGNLVVGGTLALSGGLSLTTLTLTDVLTGTNANFSEGVVAQALSSATSISATGPISGASGSVAGSFGADTLTLETGMSIANNWLATSDGTDVTYTNNETSGLITLVGTDALDAANTLMTLNPDAGAVLHYAGDETLRVDNDAAQVSYDAGTTWYDLVPNFSGVRTTDNSIISNTTLAADAEMSVVLPSAGWYSFEMYAVLESASAVPGFKFDFNYTGTLTASSLRYDDMIAAASGNYYANEDVTTSKIIGLAAAAPRWIKITGMIDVADAGTFEFRWSQGVSDATATILKAGSWIALQYITAT